MHQITPLWPQNWKISLHPPPRPSPRSVASLPRARSLRSFAFVTFPLGAPPNALTHGTPLFRGIREVHEFFKLAWSVTFLVFKSFKYYTHECMQVPCPSKLRCFQTVHMFSLLHLQRVHSLIRNDTCTGNQCHYHWYRTHFRGQEPAEKMDSLLL